MHAYILKYISITTHESRVINTRALKTQTSDIFSVRIPGFRVLPVYSNTRS